SLHHPPTHEIFTPSLHDALPISAHSLGKRRPAPSSSAATSSAWVSFGASGRGGFRPGSSSATAAGRSRSFRSIRGDSSSATKIRSEEHTSELQSRFDLVCRLLLE